MLNQEDDLNYMKLRLAAVMQAFRVKWDDLRDDRGELMLRMSWVLVIAYRWWSATERCPVLNPAKSWRL